ncbi:MAG: vanadium-dependent haloperoxidase [Ahniella sp.]|nr:vanadium-dependent haloperoxidase [Ahniella sp.]
MGIPNVPGFIRRSQEAFEHRLQRAQVNLIGYPNAQPTNGDDALAGFYGSYSKGLPHNALGEVDPNAYFLFVKAIESGKNEDYAMVPMGGTAKQISPQASTAFQMEGRHSGHLRMPVAPPFNSELRGAEMAEVYWMSLLRDLPFSQYDSDAVVAQAVTDLKRFNLFSNVSAQTLFRGITAGEKIGPYLSQLLWKTIPYGMTTIPQKYSAGLPNREFMTSPTEVVNIQRGIAPSASLTLDTTPHYMRNGRDLAEYVHKDFSYQAFMNAALILLGYGGAALDDNNPTKAYANRAGFVTFGGPDILSAVAQIGVLGLKAAWFQKWQAHRTLRPEVFALRVHNTKTGAKSYPIEPKLLGSPVLAEVFARHGSYCLPMAFAEGSPTHPSYPAGHAAIAGACTTVLKAFFKESFVIPDPVVASDDGTTLNPYTGGSLTLGGELDKLAANIAIGRNIAGVHYWSDGIEGMLLGEQVGIAFLADMRSTYTEGFNGFTLTKFDGTTITI